MTQSYIQFNATISRKRNSRAVKKLETRRLEFKEKKSWGGAREKKHTDEDRMTAVLDIWDSLRCPQISTTFVTILPNIDFSCGLNGPKASFPLRPSGVQIFPIDGHLFY